MSADDTTLAADTIEDAQHQLDLMLYYSSRNMLDVNVGKTECMGINVADDTTLLRRSRTGGTEGPVTQAPEISIHVFVLRASLLICCFWIAASPRDALLVGGTRSSSEDEVNMALSSGTMLWYRTVSQPLRKRQ